VTSAKGPLWGRQAGYPARTPLVFLAFLAFVVARYVQLGARRDILATVRFEFLLGVAVIVMVSYEVMRQPPVLGRVRPLVMGIGFLFLAMVVQVPFAAAPAIAQTIFMDRVIKFAFLTYFMATMIESPRDMRLFLAAFLFSTFYVTQEAVHGLITGGLVWQNQGVMRLHGAVPIYAHPNSLAGVAMGSIPFVAFLLFRTKRLWLKAGLLATAGTSVICVIYTGSRTGYLGFFAFVAWWWFQSERKVRNAVLGLAVGIAVLPLVPDQYVERFKSIGGQEAEGQSKETRIQILEDAVQVFIRYPYGVGVASFPAVRSRMFGRIQDTHNLYLEVATNLGAQGLIIFLGLVGVMMFTFRRTMFSFRAQLRRLEAAARKSGAPPPALRRALAHHAEDLRYLMAVAKAAGGFILVRLVLGLFGMDLYEVYWWFGAGLAFALSGLELSTARVSRRLLQALEDAAAPPIDEPAAAIPAE
jgi:putative inorganic carbon (HCO3(-)) transporter